MDLIERFLDYVSYDTQSSEESDTTPSTPKQMVFARHLADQLREIGLSDVDIDDNGYIMASLPANTDKKVPVVGFISHFDTSPDCSGADIQPRIVKNYDGGDIELSPGIISSPKKFPELLAHKGEDIIVTVDGKPTLHATSHTLKVDLEVKDVRTKDTNGKEKYPGDISWSVDVEGLVVIDADLASSHDKPEDILQTILSKTNVGVVLKANIQGLLTKNYSGNGYITSFSLGTPAGDNATYNFSITGSGNLNPVNPS